MSDTPADEAARVARLLKFLSSRPGSNWVGHANAEMLVPCHPYAILIRQISKTNLEIELHLHKNKDQWKRLEPLLNTRPGMQLTGKIRRFRDNWNEVRDQPENAFRLITTLAQVFAILLPEDPTP